MPNPPHATFTFTLDSFRITETRSRHKDSDYVSFTLLTKPHSGHGNTTTLKKSMGDLNNGTFPVNLSFKNISVGEGDTVVMNYLIVNSGHKKESEVYSALETTGGKLATAGLTAAAGALVGSAVPGLGTAIGAAAGWITGEITGLLNANCDGTVAVEQNTFTYDDLLARTAHGVFTHETKHPGTNSPDGCGKNSVYYVKWHIEKA